MSKSAMGALVRYCGHKGVFVADIFLVGNVNVVKANGPVSGDNLNRHELEVASATHYISDFPDHGVLCPERGIFVVPKSQVKKTAKS